MHLLLLVHLVLALFPFDLCIELLCPSASQWSKRAEIVCNITEKYYCIYDDNVRVYKEMCRETPTFDSAGHKVVIVGGIQGVDCVHDIYQPFKYWTNGSSTCAFKKTPCNAEGQVIHDNGTIKTDRHCRCDYSKGYDFIKKPKNSCYCEPSKEDCSCYKKQCPSDFVLSQDYNCIHLTNWSMQSTCSMIPDDTDTGDKARPIVQISHNEDIEGIKKSSVMPKTILSILIGLVKIMIFITALTILKGMGVIWKFTSAEVIWQSHNQMSQDKKDAQTHLKQLLMKKFSDFVETTASKRIEESIQKEQCIIVSGPMGCGKSSTAYHIATKFKETMDFNLIIISNPDDLYTYVFEDKKQICLVDDVFGKYSVSEYKTMWWNHHGEYVQNILNKNKDLKLIMTSRLHIFLSVNLQKPTFCHLNLTSDDLVLSLEERKRIGRCYLRDDIIDGIGQEVIMSTSFFPALCSSVRAENKEHIIESFTLPVEYISSETINMRKYGDVLFVALTILLIFDNKVKKEFFNDSSHQYDEMLQFLSKEIGFDTQPLKSLLFSRFIALKKSYVLENTEYFECLHINLFNALVLSIGPCIMRTLIVYGESSFLNKRTCFETSGEDYPKLKIVIPTALEDIYFERMLSDVQLGKYDLFDGDQHSSVEFRKSCMIYLKKYLNKGDWKKGSHGTTVLHVVSAKGFSDYVMFFLGLENTLGTLKDNYGQTALHIACMHGHTHVAKILVDNGVSINMTDNNNETALYIACKSSKSETVKYLVSLGANIKPKTCDLKSPLHVACLKGNTEIAKFLLAKINVNYQDTNKNTPLHLACANGRAKVVELLVQYKLDINLADFESKTAMYIAAEQGNTDIVRCLMGLSPNLDIATDKGRVALHCASEHGFEEIARLLIEQKASINIADKNGCTPLYVACENGRLKIVKLLLGNNAIEDISNALKSTPLFTACGNDNIEIVRLLLERKPDANFRNSDQMTPLHKACVSDQTDIVLLLIKYGASVNKPDKDLQTPLTIACLKGNFKVVDALLKVGASVNYANRTGLTPLHAACMTKQKEIVQLLLYYDADITKEAIDGLTPLEVACKSGNKCIEDALLMKLNDKQKNT